MQSSKLKAALKRVAEMYFPIEMRPSRWGWVMFPTTDKYVGLSFKAMGEYSPVEVDCLRAIIRPGDTVLNAGANVGGLMLPIADKVGPSGRVICIEPQWFVFRLLQANVNLNDLGGLVEVHNFALGKAPGKFTIPVYDYRTENNYSGLGVEYWKDNTVGLETPIMTLDELGLKKLDVLQADVEQMEKDVLEGGQKTIAALRPRMFLENTHKESSAELIEYVRSLDYTPYWIITLLFSEENYFDNKQSPFDPMTCTFNMYCVPKEKPNWAIGGLRECQPDDPVGCVPGDWIITKVGAVGE